MSTKDKLNKIFGITSLDIITLLVAGHITENYAMFGFPNVVLLYILMPIALVWFGTRKNGCGSCNQTCNVLEKQDQKTKE